MIVLDTPSVENVLGFIALIGYVITLVPSILKIVFPLSKKTGIPNILLKQRRLIGILAFVVAAFHGLLLIQKRQIDFTDFRTGLVYFPGIVPMTIFTLLAVTSNDWSMKTMKKGWKNLHKLTYPAMFVLVWHILAKMWGHWTLLTPFSLVTIIPVTGLYLLRLWQENVSSKKPKKISS